MQYTAADTQFVLEKIRSQLLKVDSQGNPLKDANGQELGWVLDLVFEGTIKPTFPFPQNVLDEGPGLSTESLDLAHVYLQLNQARQYWLDQGASLSRLNQATFAIADLPTGWAARTEGMRITLDASGAGWGWFVDTSPEEHSEFVPTSTDPVEQAAHADYSAAPGSLAEGKLDLLTVLIHELGHALGLPMPQAADGSGAGDPAHAMSQYLHPGQRRLPDAVDIAALHALGVDAYPGNVQTVGAHGTGTAVYVGTTVPPAPPAINPTLLADGWRASGNVVVDETGAAGGLQAAVLAESGKAQAELVQVFQAGVQDRFLRFTVQDGNLKVNGASGPQDAFEVALIDVDFGTEIKITPIQVS